MGPWADTIVSVAGVAAAFLAVMAFRGLIEGLEGFSGRCDGCHRVTLFPLPISHRCWHCRHAHLSAAQTPQGELSVKRDAI